ncbi:nucleotide-binding protein [Rhodomicrobium sp. Az07]|uniref:TIR domain-containing protein n=1 Tax=Rhodomicrobium sp. Az07 TaxID=2839034 RepID=UPI001BEA5520|nr:TIR domain-containing protein [Rhodomicrobium sp. Az07]MBT3069636.1 nucleotide-binding protein [Rhodomicrobium sp. Az07]
MGPCPIFQLPQCPFLVPLGAFLAANKHFNGEAAESDKTLNDQAVCFFQLAQAADLGALIIGRKGQPTRFEFNELNARAMVEAEDTPSEECEPSDASLSLINGVEATPKAEVAPPATPRQDDIKRVFITHGKNQKILEHVKQVVLYGKFEPVIAVQREAAAKPVPDKVMDEMRSCDAAVIHVSVEEILYDKEGKERPQLNGNVLIEIGAAMALYGRNFILLVEEGVQLPSNLQGLYECRYSGDELDGSSTLKLLKAFNEFK